jgi:hypothetical protein
MREWIEWIMSRSMSATLNVVECDQAVVDVADHNDQSFCSSTLMSNYSRVATHSLCIAVSDSELESHGT